MGKEVLRESFWNPAGALQGHGCSGLGTSSHVDVDAVLHLPLGGLGVGWVWGTTGGSSLFSCSLLPAAGLPRVLAGSSSEALPAPVFGRAAAENDFLHNMIRKAVEGKDINHKGQGSSSPVPCGGIGAVAHPLNTSGPSPRTGQQLPQGQCVAADSAQHGTAQSCCWPWG